MRPNRTNLRPRALGWLLGVGLAVGIGAGMGVDATAQAKAPVPAAALKCTADSDCPPGQCCKFWWIFNWCGSC